MVSLHPKRVQKGLTFDERVACPIVFGDIDDPLGQEIVRIDSVHHPRELDISTNFSHHTYSAHLDGDFVDKVVVRAVTSAVRGRCRSCHFDRRG